MIGSSRRHKLQTRKTHSTDSLTRPGSVPFLRSQWLRPLHKTVICAAQYAHPVAASPPRHEGTAPHGPPAHAHSRPPFPPSALDPSLGNQLHGDHTVSAHCRGLAESAVLAWEATKLLTTPRSRTERAARTDAKWTYTSPAAQSAATGLVCCVE